MSKSDMMVAATMGPEYIPLFRRLKQKKVDKKLCHRDVMNLVVRAEHRPWSFETALGDTIREKFESLYVKIHDITKELADKEIVADKLIADTWIAAIFETSCSGWWPYNDNGEIVKVRNINNRWDLYKDKLMDEGLLLITRKEMDKGIVLKTDIMEHI